MAAEQLETGALLEKEQSKTISTAQRCAACSASNLQLKFPGVEDLEYLSYGPVDFACCTNCGLIQQSPLPTKEMLGGFYPPNYRNYLPVKRTLLSVLKDIQADGFASRIARHIGKDKGQKILDIGFGNGQLLLALRRRGYEHLSGSDYSPRNCSYLQEEGIRLAFGDMEAEFPFNEQFDCIIMNNVIEHFIDPVAVIAACQKHLNQSGKLIMVTPNADAFELAWFKKHWAGFHAPRHTFVFAPGNIKLIAAKLGFKSANIEGFDDPGQWSISIQNVLQANAATKSELRNGLASYTVPVSLVLAPFVVLQKILGKSTALLCVLER